MNNAPIFTTSGAIAVAHILIRIVAIENEKIIQGIYKIYVFTVTLVYNYYINIITNTIPLSSNIISTLNHISFAPFHLVLLL